MEIHAPYVDTWKLLHLLSDYFIVYSMSYFAINYFIF